MKTKAKSVQVFEVRIWDLRYFHNKRTTQKDNLYHGHIINSKTKKKKFFHTPAQFLLAIEKLLTKRKRNDKRI